MSASTERQTNGLDQPIVISKLLSFIKRRCEDWMPSAQRAPGLGNEDDVAEIVAKQDSYIQLSNNFSVALNQKVT